MINSSLKVTVERGKENDFIVYCNTNGIMYRQYPEPIAQSFRVELYESLVIELLHRLDYVESIDVMPPLTLN